MRYTVFCVVGKKGVPSSWLQDVCTRSDESMKTWLRDKVFAGNARTSLKERDFYDAFKTTVLDFGKDKVDRVLFFTRLDAETKESASEFAESFILVEDDQAMMSFAFPSFDEIIDPVNSEGQPVHHVKSSKRQTGYWRTVPYTYDLPTDNMRKARSILTETAFTHGRGKFGTAKITDEEGREKEIPASAKPVKEDMEGLKIAKPKPAITPSPETSAVDRLRKFAEILSRVPTAGT